MMERHKLATYIIGFVLSVLLTLDAYLMVTQHLLSGGALVAGLAATALAQLVVQLGGFLHLGQGTNARWNTLAFGFMGLVVAILVGGSLWIMSHLDYNMSPRDVDTYIMEDEGIGK